MRENRLRTLLSEGKPTLGTRVQSSWPTITEIVGRSQQFDYVEFLAEYAPYDLYALDNIARAIELSPNFTGMIKIERSAQAHVAVRAMAAGIQNLLFTDVRSGQDAEDCVRIAKPEVPGSIGTHGNDAGRAAIGGVVELVKRYEDSVIVLMIEKKGAVENLEAILRVKGVDMVQFGPSDYGMSIGVAGQRNQPTPTTSSIRACATSVCPRIPRFWPPSIATRAGRYGRCWRARDSVRRPGHPAGHQRRGYADTPGRLADAVARSRSHGGGR